MNISWSLNRLGLMLWLVCGLGGIAELNAQKVKVSLFENLRKEALGPVDQNLVEYRKIQKQNKAFLKQQKKKYRQYLNSAEYLKDSEWTKNLSPDSLAALEAMQKEYFLYTDELHSYQDMAQWDSAAKHSKSDLLSYSKYRLSGNYYYDKYEKLNQNILGYYQALKQYKDSLKATDTPQRKQEYLIIVKKEELNRQYNQNLTSWMEQEIKEQKMIDFPLGHPEFENALQLHETAKRGFDPANFNQSNAKAINYFAGKDQTLQSAMDKTSKLKKKYSEVINADDLSNATKRNSLKGTKLSERLVFGGDFQIRIDQSTSVDLNPELGYLLSKRWSIGVGGNYRFNSQFSDITSAIHKQSVFGWRAFSEYLLISSFYAHVEFESLSARVKGQSSEQPMQWNNSLLAGIEKQFLITGNLRGQVSMLYNFNYQNNPLYSNAWNVRFGISVRGRGREN